VARSKHLFRYHSRVPRKKLWGLALIALVVASIVVLIVFDPQQRTGHGNSIALIDLSGPIQESASVSLLGGGSAITPDLVRDRLESARRDAGIEAVVLRIDTPGGTVAASQEIAAMVREFPEPIVVSMGDVAASGGYYVSAQADSIVAQPGTLTGSIGVIWSSVDPSRLLRKLGIEIDTVTAGKHKDMFLPGGLTPQRRQLVQRLVDTMYRQFVSAVARGRDLSIARVRRLATGELYTGKQARGRGLVDRLGGLDSAISEAERLAGIENASIVELSPTFFEQLFSQGSAGTSAGSAEDDLLGKAALLRELLTKYSVPRYGLR
jgi:protease-4